MTISTMLAAAATAGFDVDAATRAYLAMVQGPVRTRSDAYFEGGYWLILWDMVAAVVVALIVLATGWSARWRDWAARVTRRRWLQPALYALPYTIATTLLVLRLAGAQHASAIIVACTTRKMPSVRPVRKMKTRMTAMFSNPAKNIVR